MKSLAGKSAGVFGMSLLITFSAFAESPKWSQERISETRPDFTAEQQSKVDAVNIGFMANHIDVAFSTNHAFRCAALQEPSDFDALVDRLQQPRAHFELSHRLQTILVTDAHLMKRKDRLAAFSHKVRNHIEVFVEVNLLAAVRDRDAAYKCFRSHGYMPLNL